MTKQKIAKIILSKVLEMPINKYLKYIKKTAEGLMESFSPHGSDKKIYAKVMIKEDALCFEVLDERLENIYPTENCTKDKTICSLKWVNTRNKFSFHILKSLLDYQNKYWFSGKEADLKPLTLRQFLSLYPFQYLEQSRLSRLISNLKVLSPKNHSINLGSLFVSEKKYHSYLIKEIVKNAENALKDKNIQYLSAQKGVHLSLRTICNCRNLFNIPSYRERETYSYEKDVTFSSYIIFSKKTLIKFQLKQEFMN